MEDVDSDATDEMSASEVQDGMRRVNAFLSGPLKELPSFLSDVNVYLDAALPLDLRLKLTRFVVAYNG